MFIQCKMNKGFIWSILRKMNFLDNYKNYKKTSSEKVKILKYL